LAVCDSAEEEINGVIMQETYDRKERGMKCNYFGDKKNRHVRARRSFPGWRARGEECMRVAVYPYIYIIHFLALFVCMQFCSFLGVVPVVLPVHLQNYYIFLMLFYL